MGFSHYDERLGAMKQFQLFKTFKWFKMVREPFHPSSLRLRSGQAIILHPSNQRGVALVVVLWIFVFLFVVAFDFAASVREEGMAAYRHAEETEGYYLALAGFQHALYGVLNPKELGAAQRTDLIDGDWREQSFKEAFYRVRLLDEGGKININRANEETLRLIFTNLGIEEPRRTILVDSLIDWRDEDNLHRVNGAEDDYYLSLSPPYTAKNGPLDTVEELLWVRGMTAELFYGLEENGVRRAALKDIFTVDNPQDRINLRTATAEVIHALLGIPLTASRAFVEERKTLSEKTLGDMLGLLGLSNNDAARRYFVVIVPSVITIEAAGYHVASAPQRQLKGVVRVLGDRGFELVRWVDRDTAMPAGREE